MGETGLLESCFRRTYFLGSWGLDEDPHARLADRRPETTKGGASYGPKQFADHCRWRRRPQSLSRRNPQVSDAGTAGRVHARQAVPGA
nr:hypothetical protein [Ensifer sp. Root278]